MLSNGVTNSPGCLCNIQIVAAQVKRRKSECCESRKEASGGVVTPEASATISGTTANDVPVSRRRKRRRSFIRLIRKAFYFRWGKRAAPPLQNKSLTAKDELRSPRSFGSSQIFQRSYLII